MSRLGWVDRAVAIAFSALAALNAGGADAFGSDDRWTAGYGQGVTEAVVTYGPGNRIMVACNEGGNPYVETGISFMLAGQSAPGSHVVLTFDGRAPEQVWISEGAIGSACRACAATFDHVIGLMKLHKSVHVLFANGDGATFTLAGSAEAIGACRADFARE